MLGGLSEWIVAVASIIAAWASTVAALTGVWTYKRQRRKDMRQPPIFEVTPEQDALIPDVLHLGVTVRNQETADYVLEGIDARYPIFIAEKDIPQSFHGPGHPVDWAGVENVPLHRFVPAGRRTRRNGDHYSFSLSGKARFAFSSRATRASIWFVWSWKDESRSRKTRKSIHMAPKVTS